MFYILTSGSTASVWLSRVLTQHPDIVCFHGVKRLSLDADNPSEPAARRFVHELNNLYSLSQGEQLFGSTHGFAATEIAPEIAAVEGSFTATIRHPITRLNSLFHRMAEVIATVDLPVEDIYRPFRENERELGDIGERKAELKPLLADYAYQFDVLCNNVLQEDTFILNEMDRQDVFEYEKLIADPEYFRACFERIAEGCRHFMAISTTRRGAARLECSQSYLDRVFAMGIVNKKTFGHDSPEDVFAKWPERFKASFRQHVQRQGGKDAVDRYASFGYRLPDSAKSSHSSASIATTELKPYARPVTEAEEAARTQIRSELEGAGIVPADTANRLKQMLAVIDAERADFGIRTAQMQSILAAERVASGARISHLQDTIDAERAAYGAHIKQLQERLEAERDAYGSHIKRSQELLATERNAFGARIEQLQERLEAERDGYGIQIKRLQEVLAAERGAFGARISQLQDTLTSERDAYSTRITELQDVLAAERDVFSSRTMELQANLATARDASTAQVKERLGVLTAERDALYARVAEVQSTLVAERKAYTARIAELQDVLTAERGAVGARIKELQDNLMSERAANRQ
jgi:hypothetical protein